MRKPSLAVQIAKGIAMFVGALVYVLALARCASAPVSQDNPRAACQFDAQGRFVYVLMIERNDEFTRWQPRQPLTHFPALDTEIRVSPSYSVRPGFCPDEMQSIIGRDPWRQ